ncbi:MAG: cytidine deaminase [Oligoflexia bacterium]|nr:cytidine deaminase [Oligoflexia bacterium]
MNSDSNKNEIIKKLRDEAIKAHHHSYSPYSNAKVGSALITDKGNIYSGCNVENGSYGATVCAERIAIFKAVSCGERKISKIYVYTKDGWPPCGMCRQVIREFATDDTEVIIGNEQGEETIYTVSQIYPLSFGPSHLGI